MISPGFKYNLADINAAIALVQLGKLEQINIRRQEIAERYLKELADTPFLPLATPTWQHRHAWHLFIIRVDEATCGISRSGLMEALKERGIGTGLAFPRGAHPEVLPRALSAASAAEQRLEQRAYLLYSSVPNHDRR